MKPLKFIAIIPARYASTRFPAKPLALLGGKPVIERVYEQVKGVVERVVVATDDERIEQAVKAFGGECVMTSTEHRSGTDRCWEAYCKQGEQYDVVINVQGDEPFIAHSQLRAIMACFDSVGESQFAQGGPRCRVACYILLAFGHSLPSWRGARAVAAVAHLL